jgi:PAS domain S-box-containing protein
MSAASISPVNFRLVLRDSLSDSYEMSKVLLATADFDGTLQLLTSGWERVLGYGREELRGKTLVNLMWSDRRGAAAAVAAILDRLCRNGLAKCFRLHRHYDKHEHMMYIVADEMPENRAHVVRERAERRAAGCRA